MSASDKELPVCTVSKVEDADSQNQPKAKRGKKGIGEVYRLRLPQKC